MGDEGDIIPIIDCGPLRKAHQHRASGADLAGSDQKAQVAGAGQEDPAQYGASLEDCGEGDHAFIIDGGKTEAVKAAAARGWVAARHELAQHTAAIKIKHLQRFPTPPDRPDKCDFVPIVKHWRIEFDEGAVLHAWRISPAQRDSFEAAVSYEKNPLGGARPGNARTKCDLARVVQRRKRVPRKFRQDAAARYRIADRCRLRNPCGGREENTFRRLRPRHAGVKGNLASSVNRRNDRLRADIEAVETTAARCRLSGRDHEAQRMHLRSRILQSRPASRFRQTCP